MTVLQAGIVGGTGFTAGELIRILLRHPQAGIAWVSSRSLAGTPVDAVHTDLAGETDLVFAAGPGPADVLFLCLPHGESRAWLDRHRDQLAPGTKVIDLGSDFRLQPEWGGGTFVYGLTEFHREAVAQADYIANPGCFATAIQLGLLPLLSLGDPGSVHVVGITGSTGAGRSLQETTQFHWRNNNISPYKTFSHQHLGEVRRTASQVSGITPSIHFVPWRGDFTRGIFVTLMVSPFASAASIGEAFHTAYAGSSFAHVSGRPIDLKQVVNTNKALIYVESADDQVAVHVAIDNLLKGASGQAVQNMNLMFGLPETAGLHLKAAAY